jgi:hypothetical protein
VPISFINVVANLSDLVWFQRAIMNPSDLKLSFAIRPALIAAGIFALLSTPAPADPVGDWYVCGNADGNLINQPSGAFRYVLGPGGNIVQADVGPFALSVGGSLSFSGFVTNNVSTLLWNDIQFRWGILDSGGNTFHGVSGVNGNYTNYHGYWAGNPNNNPHPIHEVTNVNLVWWTITGVADLGAAELSTGSAASSPPLGVYAFSIAYHRISTNQLLITAVLTNSQAGVYAYRVSAVDAAVASWSFDRVGMYFNPGVNSTGTLGFGGLTVNFSSQPSRILAASDFDDATFGRDGWTGINSQGGGETVTYAPTNGLYLGGITWEEPVADGAGTYYVAPAKFLGDQRAAYNGTLTFVLRRHSGGAAQPGSDDVILSSSSLERAFSLPALPPVGSWVRVEIPLNEISGWTNRTAQRPATREDFTVALSAINRLWIRAEFASGGDASDLDVVTLWGQPSGPLQPVLAMNVQPEIWIAGAVGRTYRIEHQDDLEPTNVWLELAEVVLPGSPFRFMDETALGVPRRFYRAVLLP